MPTPNRSVGHACSSRLAPARRAPRCLLCAWWWWSSGGAAEALRHSGLGGAGLVRAAPRARGDLGNPGRVLHAWHDRGSGLQARQPGELLSAQGAPAAAAPPRSAPAGARCPALTRARRARGLVVHGAAPSKQASHGPCLPAATACAGTAWNCSMFVLLVNLAEPLEPQLGPGLDRSVHPAAWLGCAHTLQALQPVWGPGARLTRADQGFCVGAVWR